LNGEKHTWYAQKFGFLFEMFTKLLQGLFPTSAELIEFLSKINNKQTTKYIKQSKKSHWSSSTITPWIECQVAQKLTFSNSPAREGREKENRKRTSQRKQ
jgi:hypothetical protein